jgi:hypothetical protein
MHVPETVEIQFKIKPRGIGWRLTVVCIVATLLGIGIDA